MVPRTMCPPWAPHQVRLWSQCHSTSSPQLRDSRVVASQVMDSCACTFAQAWSAEACAFHTHTSMKALSWQELDGWWHQHFCVGATYSALCFWTCMIAFFQLTFLSSSVQLSRMELVPKLRTASTVAHKWIQESVRLDVTHTCLVGTGEG